MENFLFYPRGKLNKILPENQENKLQINKKWVKKDKDLTIESNEDELNAKDKNDSQADVLGN